MCRRAHIAFVTFAGWLSALHFPAILPPDPFFRRMVKRELELFTMSKAIEVHLLPELVVPDQLRRKAVVVIDVLRASTTITAALAAGAREIVPCLEVEEARRIAAELGTDALKGGERGGLPIDGFEFGNSPSEYTPQRVAGKLIAFTSTNGTKAMQRCRDAALVVIGSFVNLSAVCRVLAERQEIVLLCAGTCGEITAEDALFAGAVVNSLEPAAQPDVELNDQAALVRDAWRTARSSNNYNLADLLRQTQGGRNLTSIGLSSDIELAAEVDSFNSVPHLDTQNWRIRVVDS